MTDSVVLANGNTLKIVQTSGSGGGKWGRPGFLNLVEIVAGTTFKSVAGKNVIRTVSRRAVDTRHTGPRSSYAAVWAELERRLEAEAATA